MSKFDNILVTVLAVAAGIGVYCLLPSISKKPLTLTEEHVIERNIEPIMEEDHVIEPIMEEDHVIEPIMEEDHVIEPIMEEDHSAQAYGFSNDDAEIKSIEVDGRECIAIIGTKHAAISCNWSK